MNVRIIRRFPSCTNRCWMVFLFIISAIVIASSGCRHAPVFSDDSKMNQSNGDVQLCSQK
ncbi:hypothetical protein KAH27_06060 [bacterium]|nr:hypothetical protein [bacterium]